MQRRATISAVIGVGILLGSALGAVTGAVFLDDPERGILVVAVLLVVLAVTAVVVAPDQSITDYVGLDAGATAQAIGSRRCCS